MATKLYPTSAVKIEDAKAVDTSDKHAKRRSIKPIPYAVLDDKRLTEEALAVILHTHVNGGGEGRNFSANQTKVNRDMGMSGTVFHAAIRLVKSLGYLKRTQPSRKNGRSQYAVDEWDYSCAPASGRFGFYLPEPNPISFVFGWKVVAYQSYCASFAAGYKGLTRGKFAERFGLSESTNRRQIRFMSDHGLMSVLHGGVLAARPEKVAQRSECAPNASEHSEFHRSPVKIDQRSPVKIDQLMSLRLTTEQRNQTKKEATAIRLGFVAETRAADDVKEGGLIVEGGEALEAIALAQAAASVSAKPSWAAQAAALQIDDDLDAPAVGASEAMEADAQLAEAHQGSPEGDTGEAEATETPALAETPETKAQEPEPTSTLESAQTKLISILDMDGKDGDCVRDFVEFGEEYREDVARCYWNVDIARALRAANGGHVRRGVDQPASHEEARMLVAGVMAALDCSAEDAFAVFLGAVALRAKERGDPWLNSLRQVAIRISWELYGAGGAETAWLKKGREICDFLDLAA